jgi:hypothetical protein
MQSREGMFDCLIVLLLFLVSSALNLSVTCARKCASDGCQNVFDPVHLYNGMAPRAHIARM